MATIRVEKRKDYTVLANASFDDERLSLKAVGLLGFMLRLPDDWNFTLEWLAGKHKDGLASIRSAMKELEAAGYVSRSEQIRTDSGTFRGADYIVREIPEGAACENRMRTACDFRTRSLIEKPNTKKPSNPPKPPRGRREKAACEWEPVMFERFWKLYPRGEDKAAARYEWDLLQPDHELMRRMSAALKRQMLSDEWRRGVGVPYACRWLSKRRWEADNKATAVSAPNTGSAWLDEPEVS